MSLRNFLLFRFFRALTPRRGYPPQGVAELEMTNVLLKTKGIFFSKGSERLSRTAKIPKGAPYPLDSKQLSQIDDTSAPIDPQI
ncbi:MAG: hypothetical protein FJ267_12940 [Planctomycetes bacterium]|nr:hypothetical protein [Planctomycetota bacterium]